MIPPLFWVALAFLAGLVFSDVTNISVSLVFIGLASVILFWGFLSRTKKTFPITRFIHRNNPAKIAPVILILSFFLGAIRLQLASSKPSPDDLAWYNDKGISTVTGIISIFPDKRDDFQLLTFDAKQISIGNIDQKSMPISGKAIIRTGTDLTWQYGDEIQLIGRLTTPTDEADFSYQDYLARKSILSSLYYPEIVLITRGQGNPVLSWIYHFRKQAIDTLSQIFPAPESALLSGILLGYDNDIPPDIQAAFRKTGTSHIIAISGFNISILAALFSTFFFRLFGARRGVLITVIVLFSYVLLTGASPSIIRAAIMGCLGLFANLLGRRQNGINSLAFVCTIMCLFNPFLPWDISFQLSFLSTLGLILFAEPMVEWVKKVFNTFLPADALENFAEKVGEYILFTLAALIMTFPVMAYHFHTFSWLSFFANPLILPAQPAVMILGGLSLLFGMVWLPLGQIIAYLAWPFTAYTIRLVSILGSATNIESSGIYIGMGFVVIYYSVLLLFLVKNKGSFIKRLLQPNLVLLIGGALTVTIWRYGLSLPDGNLHVYILENGPSENILIRSPEGRHLLINAGSQSSILANSLGRYLSSGDRILDKVFLPVADKQAIRSMRHGCSGITIEELIWLGDPSGYTTTRDLEKYLSIQATSRTIDTSRFEYALSSDASLVLLPFPDSGGIFILKWQNFNMLIPISIDNPDWINVIPEGDSSLTFSIILLAGNGSIAMNPVPMINKLGPAIIIINSTTDQAEAITPLVDQGRTILTTNQNGWIHISTTGEKLWVEVARNP